MDGKANIGNANIREYDDKACEKVQYGVNQVSLSEGFDTELIHISDMAISAFSYYNENESTFKGYPCSGNQTRSE